MPNELDEIVRPAVTENIKGKRRKTLLELLPDAFKLAIDEKKPNYVFNNIKPNTVALTAKILDELIKLISDDWSIPVEKILKEFKLDEALEEAIALYSIRKSELIKGFFMFKGTKVDISYILRVSGYNMDIYDYQRLTRTPKADLKNFEYNEKENTFYYIGANGHKKKVNNCELFAIINVDLTSPNFQGYNKKTLDAIKSIITSRLLVCVYINRLGLNFFMRDDFTTPITELYKKWKDIKYRDDYFSAINWDTSILWDDKKQWDSKRVITDFMNWSKPYRFIDSVMCGTLWDKSGVNYDKKGIKWDTDTVKIDDRIHFNKTQLHLLKDAVVVTDIKDKILSSSGGKKLYDYYNPTNLIWDNDEYWDNSTARKIYGNKWDLKSIIETDRIKLNKKSKPIKDNVDFVGDTEESVLVVRYDKQNKVTEQRRLTNE